MKTIWMSCSTEKYNINCVDLRISIEFQLRPLSERKVFSGLKVHSKISQHAQCTWCAAGPKFFFAKMNNSLKKYCCFFQTCYFASKVLRSQVSLTYNLSFNFNFNIFKEGRRDGEPQNEYENNPFVIFNSHLIFRTRHSCTCSEYVLSKIVPCWIPHIFYIFILWCHVLCLWSSCSERRRDWMIQKHWWQCCSDVTFQFHLKVRMIKANS